MSSHTYTHTCMNTSHRYTHIDACMYTPMHTNTYTYKTHMCVDTCICTHTYLWIHICLFKYLTSFETQNGLSWIHFLYLHLMPPSSPLPILFFLSKVSHYPNNWHFIRVQIYQLLHLSAVTLESYLTSTSLDIHFNIYIMVIIWSHITVLFGNSHSNSIKSLYISPSLSLKYILIGYDFSTSDYLPDECVCVCVCV